MARPARAIFRRRHRVPARRRAQPRRRRRARRLSRRLRMAGCHARLRGDAGQGRGRDAGAAGGGLRDGDLHRAAAASRNARGGARRGSRATVPGARWTVKTAADPDAAITHGRRRFRACRRRRLHLLDGSGAWYPAGTTAAPPRLSPAPMFRRYSLLISSSASRSRPDSRDARPHRTSCPRARARMATRRADRAAGGQLPLLRDDGVSGPHHLRRHAVFRGLRRDFQEAGHGHRAGPRRLRLGRQSDRGRSHGVQHQDAHRHVLQRAGHDDPRRPGREHRPQHVRRQGARRLLLGRNADEARAQEIQDRERRLHHLRPADTPLGGRLRAR